MDFIFLFILSKKFSDKFFSKLKIFSVSLKELFSYDQFDFYQKALKKRLGLMKEEMIDQYNVKVKN